MGILVAGKMDVKRKRVTKTVLILFLLAVNGKLKIHIAVLTNYGRLACISSIYRHTVG